MERTQACYFLGVSLVFLHVAYIELEPLNGLFNITAVKILSHSGFHGYNGVTTEVQILK